MKMKALGLITALAIPLATGCAAHKARPVGVMVDPWGNTYKIVASKEPLVLAVSNSPDDNMLDPWGNPYKIVFPGKESGVVISPDKVMIDPWGNPYKIVPR